MFARSSAGLGHPWRRLLELQQQMDRLFGQYDRPRGTGSPAVNIWTNADGAVVTAELPGVDPAKLEITAVNNTLTIRGERDAPDEGQDRTWHRRERPAGPLARTVQLPFAIRGDSVQATCRNGVLTVKVQRPEEEKPRKIVVQS